LIADNASINDDDFVSQYADFSDEEITQLASEGGLRPEADVALRAEMHKRSIGPDEVRSLQVKQIKAKLQMGVGHNPSDRGTGLSLRGHKFLTGADQEKEIIVVTRWIVFIYMPLIPIGSYRVKRSVKGGANPEIVEKVPLQWDQVANGWMQTGSVVILLCCAWLWFRWWAIRHS
jgi:hypothetical protein